MKGDTLKNTSQVKLVAVMAAVVASIGGAIWFVRHR